MPSISSFYSGTPETETGTTSNNPVTSKSARSAAQHANNISQRLRELNEQGYTVIPNVFSPSQIAALQRASALAAALARSNSWPFLRTLPKQFPPWPSTYDPDVGIWGVQHLLHPSMPIEARKEFARCYFGDEILSIVRGLLRMDEAKRPNEAATQPNRSKLEDGTDKDEHEDMIMELFNILITPDYDFSLRWHRDDVSFAQPLDAEAAALNLTPTSSTSSMSHFSSSSSSSSSSPSPSQGWAKKNPSAPLSHVQYNIPLFRDSSLHVIPQSHLRPRTEEEQRLLAEDAFTDSLQGVLEVDIRPGDVVFYDNNIIHRGVYSARQQRATLHGSVGDKRRQGGHGRARNVLQHGVGNWIAECSFSGLLADAKLEKRAEAMKQNLITVGQRVGDAHVGYSHDD